MGEKKMKFSRGGPKPVHQPGTAKGEEVKQKHGQEVGRHAKEGTGKNRPAAKATGEASSRVAPSNPIDPNSPTILAP